MLIFVSSPAVSSADEPSGAWRAHRLAIPLPQTLSPEHEPQRSAAPHPSADRLAEHLNDHNRAAVKALRSAMVLPPTRAISRITPDL